MTTAENRPNTTPPSSVWNVPNQITTARIFLAIGMFCVLPFGYYTLSLILFLVAAGTDFLDGWYARKYNLVSQLGRILDPFADKLIICGTYIYLVSIADLTAVTWGLQAWMTVVIVARELLVTVLRGLIEGHGGDFSAKWSGKWKMVFQCVAVSACLLYLILGGASGPAWIFWTMVLSLWAAVVSTVYSGVVYIQAAVRMMAK